MYIFEDAAAKEGFHVVFKTPLLLVVPVPLYIHLQGCRKKRLFEFLMLYLYSRIFLYIFLIV